MAITTVPIRASIYFGSLVIRTPYILSFSVSKTRNSKTTFSASLKIISSDLSNLTSNTVSIYAGTLGNEKQIFSGFALNTSPSPCWEDPKYVILNISGADVLHRLEEERFTRRQMSRFNKWAVITGIQRKAPKGGQFRLVNHSLLVPTDGGIKTDDQWDKVENAMLKLGKQTPTTEGSPVEFKVTVDTTPPPGGTP